MITFFTIYAILHSKTFQSIAKKVKSVGVYGSAVEGTLDSKSDIDLWILVETKKSIIEIGKWKQGLTKEIGREVNLKVYTPEGILNLQKRDPIFFNELEYKSKIIQGVGF